MGILARIAEKKAQEAGKAIKRIFGKPEPLAWPARKYPLGIHPYAILRFDQTKYLLADGAFKMINPEGDWTVLAISEFISQKKQHYRFHLRNIQKKELFLEVCSDGEDLDAWLFETIFELYPAPGTGITEEDLLNSENGWIGYIDFHVPDGTEYYRMVMNPGPKKASPIQYRETIFTESASSIVNHTTMTYGREVKIDEDLKFVEDLIISLERDDEGQIVTISTGVNMLPNEITVL